MKEQVLVLGVTAYKFHDEGTGELREGAHVHYVNDYAFNEPSKKGMLPVKISVPMDAFLGVQNSKFPAICDLNILTLPDGKGRPKPTVTAVEYISPNPLFAAVTAK